MNLITYPWIPVRKGDGVARVTLSQLPTSGATSLASPRADFDAAACELLIGMFQTVCAPRDDLEWERWANSPPREEEVAKRFAPFVDAFDLDDPKRPFLQERGLDEAELLPITDILIDSPGKQTIDDNKDLFVKRRGSQTFCGACAAIALYTLQTFSPAGGRGNMTSIRGGGPLSTVVLGSDLWNTVWLNVVPSPTLGAKAVAKPSPDVFPWLQAPDDPKGKRTKVFATEVHPTYAFWGMPRRISLAHAGDESAGCALCGDLATGGYTGYRARPYGFDHQGSWRHPLSPTQENGGETSAVKGRTDLGGYKQWVGLVAANSEGSRHPSQVVQHYRSSHSKFSRGPARLHASGYSMDNAKVEGWCEGTMPDLQPGDGDVRERVDAHARTLIAGTFEAAGMLRGAYKEAWYDRPKDVKGDFGFITSALWTRTDQAFYESLKSVAESTDAARPARVAWWNRLRAEVLALFRAQVQYTRLGDADPQRIVKAELKLESLLLRSLPKKLDLTSEDVSRS